MGSETFLREEHCLKFRTEVVYQFGSRQAVCVWCLPAGALMMVVVRHITARWSVFRYQATQVDRLRVFQHEIRRLWKLKLLGWRRYRGRGVVDRVGRTSNIWWNDKFRMWDNRGLSILVHSRTRTSNIVGELRRGFGHANVRTLGLRMRPRGGRRLVALETPDNARQTLGLFDNRPFRAAKRR